MADCHVDCLHKAYLYVSNIKNASALCCMLSDKFSLSGIFREKFQCVSVYSTVSNVLCICSIYLIRFELYLKVIELTAKFGLIAVLNIATVSWTLNWQLFICVFLDCFVTKPFFANEYMHVLVLLVQLLIPRDISQVNSSYCIYIYICI